MVALGEVQVPSHVTLPMWLQQGEEGGRNAKLAQGGYQPLLVTKPSAAGTMTAVLILHFLDLELGLHFCQGSKLSLPPCPCQVTSHPSEEENHCTNLTQPRFPGNHQIYFPII